MTELTFRKSTWPAHLTRIRAHLSDSETGELMASLLCDFVADGTEVPYVEPVCAHVPTISLTELIEGDLVLTWEPA